MKVTIKLKKESNGIKNEKPWKMLSLLCSVDTKEEANEIAIHGVNSGVPKDQLEKLIKVNEYNGKITYQFNLLPSQLTFDRVERYGVLDIDAENLVITWDGKYANSKIKVIEGKEQINGYKNSNEHVTGWSTDAPDIKLEGDPLPSNQLPNFNDLNSLDPNKVADLPF